MVFAASYKRKKSIIRNRVRVNASYQRYRASRADEGRGVSGIAVPDTQGADVDAAAVHNGAPAAAEGQGEEVVDAAVLDKEPKEQRLLMLLFLMEEPTERRLVLLPIPQSPFFVEKRLQPQKPEERRLLVLLLALDTHKQ